MKKLLILLTVFALLLAPTIVSAQMTPKLLVIKINTPVTSDAKNVPVKMTDLTHPCTVTKSTNEYGELLYDWNNAPCQGAINDDFEITVNNIVKKTKLLNSGLDVPDNIMIFNFAEGELPKQECPVDNTPYSSCESCCPDVNVPECPSCPALNCPAIPECKPIVTEDCADPVKVRAFIGQNPALCSEVCAEIEPECPTQNPINLTTIVSVILGLLIGFAGGIKIYKKKDGTMSVTHKHIGISEYHNINTIHTDLKIRHPKGEFAPKYDLTGKYIPQVK